MTTPTRGLVSGLVVTVIAGTGWTVCADPLQRALSHVRSIAPSLTELIARAPDQSLTFRGLVETIDASDGFVYVEAGRCRFSRACLVEITDAGGSRIIRVVVDTRRADVELIASIGHELQHVVEILSNPDVRTSAEAYLFYSRTGRWVGTGRGGFETPAATAAGNAVREEIAAFEARTRRKLPESMK